MNYLTNKNILEEVKNRENLPKNDIEIINCKEKENIWNKSLKNPEEYENNFNFINNLFLNKSEYDKFELNDEINHKVKINLKLFQ